MCKSDSEKMELETGSVEDFPCRLSSRSTLIKPSEVASHLAFNILGGHRVSSMEADAQEED
jgi:hypothetical protein